MRPLAESFARQAASELLEQLGSAEAAMADRLAALGDEAADRLLARLERPLDRVEALAEKLAKISDLPEGISGLWRRP
jgi:hypothetical protein